GIILVGSERDRGRVRAELASASIDLAGEFETLAAAQAAGIAADGYLIAGRNGDVSAEDAFQERLTPRETQVLELLAEGLPNRAIAERLAISDQTVKFHVASIAGKLGAANRTDAVRRAVRRGLITLQCCCSANTAGSRSEPRMARSTCEIGMRNARECVMASVTTRQE